jgi:phosphoribosylaminoimidazole-succinocarboxamide synthase
MKLVLIRVDFGTWEQTKKLDKDRFRNNLGNLVEAYQEVAIRLNILHEQSNIRPLTYPKPKAVKIKKKWK